MQTSYNHNQFGAGLHSSSRFESQNANSRHGANRGSNLAQGRNFDKIFGQVIAGRNEQNSIHNNAYGTAHNSQSSEQGNNLFANNEYNENDTQDNEVDSTYGEHEASLAEVSVQQQLYSVASFGIGGGLSSTMQALDSHNKLNNVAKKQEQKANEATDNINNKLKELNEQKQEKLQEVKKDDSLEQVKEKISDNLEKLGLKTDSVQKVLEDPNSTEEDVSQALDSLTQNQAKQEDEQGINVNAVVEAVQSQDEQLKQQATEAKQATEQEGYKKDYNAYLKSTVNLNNGNADKHAQKIVQIKEQVADANVKAKTDAEVDAEELTNSKNQVNSNNVNNFNANQAVGTTLASTVSGVNNVSTTANANVAQSGLLSTSSTSSTEGSSDVVGGLFSKSVQLEKNVATSNVINLDILNNSKKSKLDKLAGYEDMEKVTVKSGKEKESENITRLANSEKNSSDSNNFAKNDGQQASTFSQVVGAKSNSTDKLAQGEQQASQKASFEERIAKQEDIKKITKYIDSKQTIKSIEIQLHPKDLGKLNIHLTDDNGQLHAKIVAENKDVKNMIEAQFKGIKEILEAKGIKLGSFDLQVKSTDEASSKFATTKAGFAKNSKQDVESADSTGKTFTSALEELRSRRLYV